MKVKTLLPPAYGEIEIEFPRYAEAYFGDEYTSRHYRKVTEKNGKLRSVEITFSGKSVEIEIVENLGVPEARNVDYVLGRGEYESSEKAFEEALAEAKSYFDRA